MERNYIYTGDALEVAKQLPDQCLNCIVTSPPYYGLRDYQVDGQGGLQETPQQYVEWLVTLFRELRRCLRDDGVLWLNLGDSYNGSGKGRTGHNGIGHQEKRQGFESRNTDVEGFKPKDLIPISWMVAMALQADGWYLRAPIIWSKPNPMPASVQDRVTISHEYVFMLTKSAHYWYDAEAIKEPVAASTPARQRRGVSDQHKNVAGAPGQTPHSMNKPRLHVKQNGVGKRQYADFNQRYQPQPMRNKRSVWTINPQGSGRKHYAAFPEALVEPMVLAGCPVGGLVYDPFMGSGTTAVVARKLGRDYAGSELNPDYVAMAARRLIGAPSGKAKEDTEAQDKPKTMSMFE